MEMSRATKLFVAVNWIVLSGLLVLAAAQPVHAHEDEEHETQDERLETVEEKIEAITDEMGRLESVFAVPEDQALESFSGLGPAASKVYKRDSGLSIGGYGEVRLRSFHNQDDDNENDIFDALRAVLYVGYKFDDKWVFNSELEFEHAGTGAGGRSRPSSRRSTTCIATS